MERLTAEKTESYKQILTYILVTRGPQILAYKRGTFNRVEDYLRGAHCIGFGGHVAYGDRSLFNAEHDLGLMDNAARELSEELELPSSDKVRIRNREGLEIIGLLNDDSSPAGRRHFAYILRYTVTDDHAWARPKRGEKAITQLRWLNLNQPSSFSLRDFEYWSQLCLRTYYHDFVTSQPSYLIRRKHQLISDN
jgi:predicted NUDIX family phosphoesterase